MKKLLLIAATSATILSSTVSFADGMDNEWYLRIDAGAAMFNKEKDKVTGVKLKSNTTVPVDLGIGYYISENFRADLTLGTIISGKLKQSGTAANAPFPGTNISVSHKSTITRLLINGYVDLTNFDMFGVFAGAGVGPSLVKEKVTYNGITGLASTTQNRTNISYKLTLGTSAQIADGVKAELAYSWIDDGRAKGKNVVYQGQNVQTGGMRYQSHNLTAGIRFDI
ncbi:MAG: porin family protein [Rickettsia endosymbiont of Ixodes persulcatus]|nr:porin family protein [Rickettsia endosymbiont of Ixodes persulcatus]MCZ6903509.1 porin family protein [Rickettsia endosymbiont of Ixodes persulcatus]MCZ6908762.1 porin family protein [Rickettsia endosymbiont of Ixodes persulcatus]MCZ6911116.1 porin family protein [Rickettsia endosymbiont of Ixodes persulcatus]MCZ6914858.1 porin family protein [Rickettsia endosymbiont of Ixodes persulcatus]